MKMNPIRVYLICSLLSTLFFGDPQVVACCYLLMACIAAAIAFFSEDGENMNKYESLDYSFAVFWKSGGILWLLACAGIASINPYLSTALTFVLDLVVEIVRKKLNHEDIEKENIVLYAVSCVITIVSLLLIYLIDYHNLLFVSMPMFLTFVSDFVEKFFLRFLMFTLLAVVSVVFIHQELDEDTFDKIGNKIVDSTDNYFGKLPLRVYKTLLK